MKIHYLSRSTLISDSANSVHVMKMCDAFCENGYKATLYGYKGQGSNVNIRQYYDAKHNFDIKLYDEHKTGLSSLLWKLRDKIKYMRISGLPSLVFAWQNLRPLYNAQTDLIFSRNIFWTPAIKNNVSFIFESHTPPGDPLQKWIENRLYKRKSCKGVVVISEKMKEIYEDLFPHTKGKLIVAHDGADDPGEDQIKMTERLQRPVKNIGYVGQLYSGRGIELIIEIAKAMPELNFHLVGGRPDMIEKFKALGAPENMIFHGHQPHAKLHDYYAMFDIVLAPYQKKVAVHGDTGDTSAFMSPLKIFEYMSWGLPIICSDMPVLREVLHNRENALLAAPEDAPAWINAITEIQNNQDLKQQISAESRKEFLSKYTWQQRAARILQQAGLK